MSADPLSVGSPQTVSEEPEFIRAHGIRVYHPSPEEEVEIVDFLCAIPGFKTVPRKQLEWLVEESTIQMSDIGTVFKEGEVYHFLIILLEGEFSFYVVQNNQKKILATWQEGAYDVGLLPFSRMGKSPGFSEVTRPMKILALHDSKFRDLISKNYELTEVLVHSLIDRVRMFTSLHFQNEKLMALGKLSAGLAHELNNPAAAIGRNAADLERLQLTARSAYEHIAFFGLDVEGLEIFRSLGEKIQCIEPISLPLLARKQRESEIQHWFDDHSIEEVYADTFVEFGFSPIDLEALKDSFPESLLSHLIVWIGASLLSKKATREIEASSKRISDLVQSVKNYTRMDQVHDMQETEINDGIRNTLSMLEHKIKRKNIAVRDELATGLPAIMGFPGELNQVWTNIIDNALDAMTADGELTVKTFSDSAHLYFDVIDTGVGIPPENLERIFDPFFTTKDVGEGTGVGLDVVQRIVQQHRGTISIQSRPGRTKFTVSFPRMNGN